MLERLNRFQQRHRVLALPVAVSKRFGEHDGSRLAATVSYYSFFSVFPLMLVFVTVLGIVLKDNDELRRELIDGAVGRIPLIGSQLGEDTMPGSGWVLFIGLATAIWAGLAAVSALQHGLNIVEDVPVHQRPNFVMKRVRALAFLVLFGVGICLSTVASNVATIFDVGWAHGDRSASPARSSSTRHAADDVLRAPGTTDAVAPAAPRGVGRRRAARLVAVAGELHRASLPRRRRRHQPARSPRSSPCSAGSTSSAA